MKKYIIILLLIIAATLTYNYIKQKIAENKKPSLIVVEINNYNSKTNQNNKSYKYFPVRVGTILPIGEETKITEVKKKYITLSIKPASLLEADTFVATYCLTGVDEEEADLMKNAQIKLSSCKANADVTYTIKFTDK